MLRLLRGVHPCEIINCSFSANVCSRLQTAGIHSLNTLLHKLLYFP